MTDPRAATVDDARTDQPTGSRRALFTVLAIVFVDLLGFGIVIPILPFYVRSFGVSDVFIGLLASSYSLAQFVSAPVLGRLSDRYGRRPVLMLSLAGSVVAWTLFGLGGRFGALFGTAGGLFALFGARTVAGAMGGNIATAQAYVADVTPPERRAGALGLIGAAFGLGFVFGPALGGLFASDAAVAVARDTLPAFVPATPYSLPSFAAAGLSLLAFAGAALVLPEPERTRSAAPSSLGGGLLEAVRDVNLRPLVAAFLLVSVAFSGVQVVFIPFVADVYGFGESGTALLLTYVGVLGVVNQGVLVERLSRRFPAARIALAGAVVLALALAALPFSRLLGRTVLPAGLALDPALIGLLVVLALLSLGNGLLSVALTTMVSAAAPADRQGSAFGVTQGAASLGRTVGPPVMAALYVVAVPSPFLLGAALTVGVVAVIVALGRSAG